jgi:hypothetical protein
VQINLSTEHPSASQVIGKTFVDGAWAEIVGNFGDPTEIEAARLQLFSVANDESRDVDALNQAALERIALDYRSRRQK